MKRKVRSILSVGAALCFIASCTACNSADSGTNVAENSVENININENAMDNVAIKEEFVPDESPLNVTKDQLYYRCMNSMEFLNCVSGDVKIRYGGRDRNVYQGTVNLDFVSGKYFTDASTFDIDNLEDCIYNVVTYNDSNICHSIIDNIIDGSKRHETREEGLCPTLETRTFANACPINPDDKASIEAKKAKSETVITSIDQLSEEQINATYGGDPTGDHVLGAFYIPQEMSMGYLKNFDMWDITDYKDFQGRSCAVVQGKAEPEYGSRFNVETFEILVDQATGVWMQFEGYDADGNVMQYVYSDNVRFDDDAADVPTYKDEYAEGYEKLDMNAVDQANIDKTIRKMNAEAETE